MSIVRSEANQRQLSIWNLLRPIVDFLKLNACHPLLFSLFSSSTSRVTGTIICPLNNDKVRLCIQQDSTCFPLVLLELPLHTFQFASLIRGGATRIVLECDRGWGELHGPLLSAPAWVVHCNGQKMGLAKKRMVTRKDAQLLEMMRTVTAGVGMLPDKGSSLNSGGHKYLRSQFERAVGSSDSEAYHIIDPSGCLSQELSVFFVRI